MAQHIPPTLSPDSIDTLTELTLILTQFRSAQAAARAANTTTASNLPTTGTTSTTSGLPTSHGGPGAPNPHAISTPAPGAVTGTTPLPTTSAATASFTAKDLPQATDSVKHKLQKARQAVLTLPDVGRTIEQQEEEIRMLEERKRKQIAMLARIKEEGLQFARMEGMRQDEEGERMVE
ncbi:RNA polymerase II transcription mediator complex subunit 9-domain-containing protein [Sordaria brevicollis]|uniref:Mediator of RNA polymerase II transcription subunit 9 n=1 Tax=Sordaria brevicollis TaxID=83679 RepID=A0AAE0PIC9_SORBR|nr:RNA polymerase II transcription mediator complex subunit 9-domain-containing protein [Sordaria brevicollis]